MKFGLLNAKKKDVKKSPPQVHKDGKSLYRVLKSSYGDRSVQREALKTEGYILDEDLSSHNQQVYYKPEERKLVYAVTGTHNLSDVGTDAALLVGSLKSTRRFKEADRVYKQAQQKYEPEKTTVVGHSLGGTIASEVASDKDRIITYNKGAFIKTKTRKNEETYHTFGDPISMLSGNQTKRLGYRHNPHSVDHLKDEDIQL